LRPHGVRGAVKAAYYGDDPEGLLAAPRIWLIPKGTGPDRAKTPDPIPIEGHGGKAVPGGLILTFEGVATREAAQALGGSELALAREDLPEPAPDEWYQADLLGLMAVSESGRELGRVTGLMDQAEYLVLAIESSPGVGPGDGPKKGPDRGPKREILIPFTEDTVTEVDLVAGRLVVAELPGLLD
jgi:16S rRNA processing protein RimM